MIRIPLIIYFNEKAYDEFKDKFKKYKILSQNKNVSTLSQLPMTILDLKGIKDDKFNELVNKEVVGNEKIESLSKILIRKNKSNNQQEFLDLGTKMYFEIKKNKEIKNDLNACYGRSNSIGKILRGSLVTNCLETDLNFIDDEFKVTYSPKDDGLNLDQYFSIIKNKNVSVWFDLKNINKQNCNILFNKLDQFEEYYSFIFLEINNLRDISSKKFKRCLEDNYLKYDIGLSYEAISEACNLNESNSLKSCKYYTEIKILLIKDRKSLSLNYQKKIN